MREDWVGKRSAGMEMRILDAWEWTGLGMAWCGDSGVCCAAMQVERDYDWVFPLQDRR